MRVNQHQEWLVNFYQKRNWYQLSPFVRLNFLTEEVGELSRAIRAIKIGRDHPGEPQPNAEQLRDNLTEELADVLDQLLIISSKFDIAPETLLNYSEDKLKARFKDALDEE
ncbi:MazG nucleotide pyrophosphohydrolase domain-containing protein [Pediococcus acidilactici]|uniref:MazG nucleotide pyrophosphohydrolase domain-containing protein n=1 Tax=Pediococcus acidilactici TaxID=1254 RepID=A0AAW8YGP6_PEDAC|nr:MazG-like family protein [Pediococcus acidilactici]AOW75224.1 hypothetical protein A4V11_09365 [Pediococcus acidilactici]MDD9323694.1 MazG nucleotide pyrophosphohydrolase domain-containing protein [Pediococcus acidilactici]MDV2621045.1 MazG nucleotide pyrophosphohydrolase domain-containing protein [Pediococcus acidilactici]NBI15274.1 hypothetical protein [Pediococcus acidilactici]NFA45763.1 hypothetical protein [Pediococcus acidilactici]